MELLLFGNCARKDVECSTKSGCHDAMKNMHFLSSSIVVRCCLVPSTVDKPSLFVGSIGFQNVGSCGTRGVFSSNEQYYNYKQTHPIVVKRSGNQISCISMEGIQFGKMVPTTPRFETTIVMEFLPNVLVLVSSHYLVPRWRDMPKNRGTVRNTKMKHTVFVWYARGFPIFRPHLEYLRV